MWSGHRGGNERPTDADAKFWACARWSEIGLRGYFMGLGSTHKSQFKTLPGRIGGREEAGGRERGRAFWPLGVGPTIGR